MNDTPPTKAPIDRLPENHTPGNGLDAWTDRERPKRTVCVVRYGAIGDHFMAASVLPHLKALGYHITYNGNERARKVLARDPHIDRFYLQPDGQVNAEDMDAYWDDLAPNFDKVVNFTHSIEGALLPGPHQESYNWPLERRRRELDVNYLGRTHDIAGVRFVPRMAFYPTAAERGWAKRKVRSWGRPVIVWCLSGSSVHKHWPYMDNVIAALMLHTEATVVLVGGYRDQIPQVGWENEPRVKQKANIYGIRQTIALCQQVDVVVGPETGFMQAVALEHTVAKVLFLSHSSYENCGKHWQNARVLTPGDACSCYPCHRLHYGWSTCVLDYDNGGALCQTRIPPAQAYSAILDALSPAKEPAA